MDEESSSTTSNNALVSSPDPSDDTSGVDISLIYHLLSLTPTERIEANYRARTLARTLRDAARKRYGPAVDAIAPLD